MQKKFNLTREQLTELYVGKGLSQASIGKQFGMSQVTIGLWMRYFGIQARKLGAQTRAILDERELRRLYHEEKLTMKSIAKRLGCPRSAVRSNALRYGLILDSEEIHSRRLERNKTRYAMRMVSSRGYRFVRIPDHPSVDKNGYVPEHLVVAEAAIGRHLDLGEEVHHINLQKLDNRIENLAVLPGRSDHARVQKYMERVAAYLCGLTEIRPEPLDFGVEVFWGGAYIRHLDLIGSQTAPPRGSQALAFTASAGIREHEALMVQ